MRSTFYIRTRILNPEVASEPGEHGDEIVLTVGHWDREGFLGIVSYNRLVT